MAYNLQIQKILVKVEETHASDDKMRLLKEAIAIADTNNDIEWGFDLRIDLIDEENNASHDNESLLAFTWILDACDSNPDLFDEGEMLWEYKWVVNSLRNNPDVSMEQIEAITEDFKMRIQRNGYSLRSYYTAKANLVLYQFGDAQKAKEYLDLRDKELTDDLSDCDACELDDIVSVHIHLGNIEQALTIGRDLLNSKLNSSHIPFVTYCSFIKHFHNSGELERAHEFFLKAEENLAELEKNGDTSQVGNIGIIIRFLTDYNKDKAWEYFKKYIHREVDSQEGGKFNISNDVLPLLSSDTQKQLHVNSAVPWFRPDGVYNLKELYNYYFRQASSLAQRFDARNGSTYFTSQLNKRD